MRANVIISLGSFNAAIAIALSAYAAHGLEKHIEIAKVATFTTAADFHLWHSLGMIIIGVIAKQYIGHVYARIALLIFTGIILFSGSLYLLSTTGIKAFAYITPFGGVAFITAWLWLAIVAYKARSSA